MWGSSGTTTHCRCARPTLPSLTLLACPKPSQRRLLPHSLTATQTHTAPVPRLRRCWLLQPVEYLNKLPRRFAADDRVLVCDPMLATGNTIVHVLEDILSRGATAEYIRVIAIVTAPPALSQLSDKFPGELLAVSF